MTLLMDPELFTINQCKEMSMWPSGDVTGVGLWPYIKRMKEQSVTILDVGVMKGENAFYLFDKDTHPENKKIGKIFAFIDYSDEFRKDHPPEFLVEYEKVIGENIKNEPRFSFNYQNETADVLCINSKSRFGLNLRKFYDKLRLGGIICGNDHQSTNVKVALSDFRRECKIGTPISISHGYWYWVKG